MKYTRIQRTNTEEFITIGEYIQETEPNTYVKLNISKTLIPFNTAVVSAWSKLKDVTEQIIAAADVSRKDKQYARIMQERPRRWN